ncbi:Uncharacterised protein [Mycobacterium tuberculosis]|nr:Uncharacterised protein [Mycobacterium tuberculosis]
MVAAVMVPIVRTAASVQENTESVPQSCPRTTAASGQATASDKSAVSSTIAAARTDRRARSSSRTAITAATVTIVALCQAVICIGMSLVIAGTTMLARSPSLGGNWRSTDRTASRDSAGWVVPASPRSHTMAVAERPSGLVPSGAVTGSDHQSRTDPTWRVSARRAPTAAS